MPSPNTRLARHVLGLASLLPAIAFAQVPIGPTPSWVVVEKTDANATEYEKSGVYTKGAYTYVAVRSKDDSVPNGYLLVVHAFNCAKRQVSTAMMGRISLDSALLDPAKLNEERILAKYNDTLPVPKYAYLTPIDAAVCAKR